jgi:hypothetical protein
VISCSVTVREMATGKSLAQDGQDAPEIVQKIVDMFLVL